MHLILHVKKQFKFGKEVQAADVADDALAKETLPKSLLEPKLREHDTMLNMKANSFAFAPVFALASGEDFALGLVLGFAPGVVLSVVLD